MTTSSNGGTLSVTLDPAVPLVAPGQSQVYPVIVIRTLGADVQGVLSIKVHSDPGVSLAPNETTVSISGSQVSVPAVLGALPSASVGDHSVTIAVESGGNGLANVTLRVEVVAALVVIKGASFHPANITVPKGTTVWWINLDSNIGCCDPGFHTVTFLSAGNATSPVLKRLDTWSYTFGKAGDVSYYCNIHPYMRGEIRVTG